MRMLLLTVSAVAVMVSGAAAQTWKAGEKVTATLSGGTLTIKGTGAMYDFDNEAMDTRPWANAIKSISKVVIENGVTSIGEIAFSYCTNLKSVTIGNSVASIRESAFAGCTGLTSVTIPNSVKSIGEWAFGGCTGLMSIEVGIGNAKYSSENGVLFDNTKTTLIKYPEGKQGPYTIPNSVKSIEKGAFVGCTGLKSITFGGVVTSIKTDKDISDLIDRINLAGAEGMTWNCGQGPDWEATSAVKATFRSGTLTIKGTGPMRGYNCYCDACDYTPWDNVRHSITKVVIENGVTSIGTGAFHGGGCYERNPNLTSVTIPNSVTSIEEEAFEANLTSLTITGSGKLAIYISEHFSGDSLNVIISEGITSIGDGAFYGLTGLKSITIPNSVTSIGQGAFYDCYGLTSITIPNSVTSIGQQAFRGCTGLTSITIPNSVTSIGQMAFEGCTGLTSITIPNSVTSIGQGAFYGCTGLTSITIPNSVTSIGPGAFYGTGITTIIITDRLTSIGDAMFTNVTSLTSITIPNSVTSIGQGAFYGCTGLTSITIPNSVTSIGQMAFEGCTGLTSITIPNSVTSIGQGAFRGCTGLTSITITNGLTSIGDVAFANLTGLKSITIPNSVTSIGRLAFQGCTGLKSITIPNSVTSIGGLAFQGCTGLTSITVLNPTPPTLGANVFYAVDMAKSCLHVPSSSINAYRSAPGWSAFTCIKEVSSR